MAEHCPPVQRTGLDRRGFIYVVGAGAAASLNACRGLAAADDGTVAVPDFRERGDADDTAALRKAIDAGRTVLLPAGRGSGNGGEYLIRDVAPKAGTTIAGDGMGRTIVRQPDTAPLRRGYFKGAAAAFFCDSGSANARISGMRFHDFSLVGFSETRGFAEHNHLVQLCGVDDVTIERVAFHGFQGDGLVLSASRDSEERHNSRIRISDCEFDGVNGENRNAISILDVDGLEIRNCSFAKCTRPDMPGAIDFEPDEVPFAVLRNIVVRGCRFTAVGGNAASIGFHIPKSVERPPQNILIAGNSFEGYRGSGAEVYIGVDRPIEAATPSMNIAIRDNRGRDGAYVYLFTAAKGVTCSGNEWTRYARGSHIGSIDPPRTLFDTRIGDRFVRCGEVGQVGLSVFNVQGLALDNSVFIDCGDGGANAYAVSFGRGRSRDVSLWGITVSSPSGKTRHAVMRERDHRFAPLTNRQGENDFGGMNAESILE